MPPPTTINLRVTKGELFNVADGMAKVGGGGGESKRINGNGLGC